MGTQYKTLTDDDVAFIKDRKRFSSLPLLLLRRSTFRQKVMTALEFSTTKPCSISTIREVATAQRVISKRAAK